MPDRVGRAVLIALAAVAACKDSPTGATNGPTVTITIENATQQYANVVTPIVCPVFSPNPATMTTSQQLLFKNTGLSTATITISPTPGTPDFQITGAIAPDSTVSAGSFSLPGKYFFWTSACPIGFYAQVDVTAPPASGQ